MNRLDWKRGSASIIYYFYIMVAICFAGIMILAHQQLYTSSEKSQMLADSIANAAATAGDTGFGIDKKIANAAKDDILDMNEDMLNESSANTKVSIEKDKSSSPVKNTAHTTATVESSTVTGSYSISAEAKSKTIYSGGQAIVMLAYSHTYQALRRSGYSHKEAIQLQTKYIWGAGRGGGGITGDWTKYADCSAFVAGVYNEFGKRTNRNYNLPAYTGSLEGCGTVIKSKGSPNYSNAMPGDILLIWWDGSGSGDSDHTGIYAGKDENGVSWYIHCSGGPDNADLSSAGKGASGGAILKRAPTGGCQVQINRIFQETGSLSNRMDWRQKESYGSLTGNAAEIARTLSASGFSDAAIAGILGNFQHESGLNPCIWNGGAVSTVDKNITCGNFVIDKGPGSLGDGGYGIAQWTNARKIPLWKFAKKRDTSVSDLTTQILFMMKELKSGFPCDTGHYSSYTVSSFKKIQSPELAANVWLSKFEGIWDGTDGTRSANAISFYNRMKK